MPGQPVISGYSFSQIIPNILGNYHSVSPNSEHQTEKLKDEPDQKQNENMFSYTCPHADGKSGELS